MDRTTVNDKGGNFTVTALGGCIDSGQIDGVDIAGTIMALAFDIPKYFQDGGWRVGVLADAAALAADVDDDAVEVDDGPDSIQPA